MFQNLVEFQSWVGENWLYPLHTQAAEDHLRAKLKEEVKELSQALVFGTPCDIAQEAGDVLWICGALCLNAYTSIEAAFIGSGVGQSLGKLLTLQQIDRLFNKYWIYWDAPIVELLHQKSTHEIACLMEEADRETVKAVVAELAHQVSKASHMHKIATERDYLDWKLYHARLNDGVTQILLAVSIIAQLEAGLTLGEICELTRSKHQRRLDAGQPVTRLPSQPQQATVVF